MAKVSLHYGGRIWKRIGNFIIGKLFVGIICLFIVAFIVFLTVKAQPIVVRPKVVEWLQTLVLPIGSALGIGIFTISVSIKADIYASGTEQLAMAQNIFLRSEPSQNVEDVQERLEMWKHFTGIKLHSILLFCQGIHWSAVFWGPSLLLLMVAIAAHGAQKDHWAGCLFSIGGIGYVFGTVIFVVSFTWYLIHSRIVRRSPSFE